MTRASGLPLQRKFRYLEWISIALTAVFQGVYCSMFVQFDSSIAVSFLALALNVAVSIALPQTVRWQFIQLCCQTLLISLASALGAHHFYYLNLYILAAKAAFQLPRTQMIVVAITLAVAHIMAGQFAQYAEQYLHIDRVGLPRYYHTVFVGVRNCLYFAISLTSVAFLGRTLLAERQNRATERELNRTIEQLAVNLEKARIARDIHDGIGHSLTSLRIQLELAGKCLQDGKHEEARRLLAQCEATARASMPNIRVAIKAATGQFFLSLNDTVNQLVEQIKGHGQLSIQMSMDEIAMPIATQRHLYNFVQECLTNIRKHASATDVQILLRKDNGSAIVSVRDDGRGFNAGEANAGFGLKGMRERAQAIGGSLEIDTKFGGGTELSIRFPLTSSQQSSATANQPVQRESESGEDPVLQKALVYLEQGALLFTAIGQIGWVNNQVEWNSVAGLSFVFLTIAIALTFLSFTSARARFAHLLIQALTVSAAAALGPHRLYTDYFLVLGAKAAVMLPRTLMITMAAVLLILNTGAYCASNYMLRHAYHHIAASQFYSWFVVEGESKLSFFVGLVAVLFLGRTVVYERQGRETQKLLSKEVEKLLVDVEREKISEDIHTSLGHILAPLVMQLELAIKLVDENKLEKAEATVNDCYESVIRCLQEVRRAVSSIRTEPEPTGDQTKTKPLREGI